MRLRSKELGFFLVDLLEMGKRACCGKPRRQSSWRQAGLVYIMNKKTKNEMREERKKGIRHEEIRLCQGALCPKRRLTVRVEPASNDDEI